MKKAKLFVIYFPVMLVTLQIAANLLYFVRPNLYNQWAFYLSTFLGTNVLFSMFLLAFTFMFRFCSVSRWAAGAEVMFAAFYLIIQRDDIYNVLFQVGVGILALAATFWHYVKKFPLCNFSVAIDFMKDAIKTGSCRDALNRWDHKVRHTVIKNYHEGKS